MNEQVYWEIPPSLFKRLNDEFEFTLDAAASDTDAKVHNYLTEHDDALACDWHGRVWLNPPFDQDLGPWLAKAVEEAQNSHAECVVAFLPVRLDYPWWHEYVLEHALEIRFIQKRIEFLPPIGYEGTFEAPYMNAIVVFNADGGPPLATSVLLA